LDEIESLFTNNFSPERLGFQLFEVLSARKYILGRWLKQDVDEVLEFKMAKIWYFKEE